MGMLIPRFWAENRKKGRAGNRRITVRRLGWSNISWDDALRMAIERTEEAFTRIAQGESLRRFEPKCAYNGADGVPIREEIVGQSGETILTRNGYGAICLNIPHVFFADIDLPERPGWLSFWLVFGLMVGGLVWGATEIGFSLARTLVFTGITLPVWLGLANGVAWLFLACLGGHRSIARKRIVRFVQKHSDWNLRVYQTPAGFRIIATHGGFDPRSGEVANAFRALGTDPIYSRMCLSQACFRARISPKPWRAGISNPIPPRRGVWPIKEEYQTIREQWIQDYQVQANRFASCRFLEEMGSGVRDPRVWGVVELHDRLCQSSTDLPLA